MELALASRNLKIDHANLRTSRELYDTVLRLRAKCRVLCQEPLLRSPGDVMRRVLGTVHSGKVMDLLQISPNVSRAKALEIRELRDGLCR